MNRNWVEKIGITAFFGPWVTAVPLGIAWKVIHWSWIYPVLAWLVTLFGILSFLTLGLGLFDQRAYSWLLWTHSTVEKIIVYIVWTPCATIELLCGLHGLGLPVY